MRLYYVNHKGVQIDLDRWPYWIQTGDILDWTWDHTEMGGRIRGFKRGVSSKKVTLTVNGQNHEEYLANLNHLPEVFEPDLYAKTPGRLYVDESYLNCYISGSAKSEWEAADTSMDQELKLVSDYPFWIEEMLHSFGKQAQKGRTGDYLDYPHDYPYDYTFRRQQDVLLNPHYGDCDFMMILYGPCTDPRIVIAGQIYEVKTKIKEGEYLVIQSREGLVYRVTQDGEQVNEFANKNNEYPLFAKIPPGSSTVSWSGDYGWEITLYIERSEPRWIL